MLFHELGHPRSARAKRSSPRLFTYDDFLRLIRSFIIPSLSLTNRAISESAALVLKDTPLPSLPPSEHGVEDQRSFTLPIEYVS
jgi:hypothetical protein